MMSSRSDEAAMVARYFDDHAKDFDDIYATDKSALRRMRDRVRGTVVQRLEFVDAVAAESKPQRVLDVGCGSGRFALRLAARGAEVVGLDFAGDMLELAERLAVEAGVGEKCSFVKADFLAWEADGAFDLGLAIGVVDYVADPAPLIAKLSDLTRGRLIVSFPRRLHPLVPLRYVRLRAADCPVHFYSRSQVEALGRSHVPDYRVIGFGRDYLLVGGKLTTPPLHS